MVGALDQSEIPGIRFRNDFGDPEPRQRIKAAHSDTRPRDPPRETLISLVVKCPARPTTGDEDKACEFVGKATPHLFLSTATQPLLG